jgi:hypothetical protein
MLISRKILAQFAERTEARRAMKGRTTPRSVTVVAAFLSAVFLWTLALSVSPQLHEEIHADANRVEHSCAVTFVASGSYDHVVQLSPISSPAEPVQFAKIPTLSSLWVQSPFLGASVFEHAPPTVS